jgi:hypothetical protein
MSIKNIFFVIVSTIVFIIAASSLLDAARVSTGNPQARLLTQYGIITFELFPENAPKTVANFINLAKTGFYKNAVKRQRRSVGRRQRRHLLVRRRVGASRRFGLHRRRGRRAQDLVRTLQRNFESRIRGVCRRLGCV